MDRWVDDDAELAETRRRTRRIGYVAVLAAALLCQAGLLLGMGVGERVAIARWGDTARDDAIDDAPRAVDAVVMSSSDVYGDWIVSYEYFVEGALFVGYQRVPADLGRTLAFEDPVVIDVAAPSPGHSRLAGTRAHPLGWVASALVRARAVLVALGLLGTVVALAITRRRWR